MCLFEKILNMQCINLSFEFYIKTNLNIHIKKINV